MLSNQPHQILVLLFDGFSNMVLASAVEPLRAARDLAPQAPFTWRLASLNGAPVCSSSGLSIHPERALAEAESFDSLLVICGYGVRKLAREPVLTAVRQAARRAKTVGGLDMGPWLLAEAGLLNGHRATVHWQELGAFEERFLDVRVSTERFVLDRNRITAGGASTVLALMLKLIRAAAGDALAFDVSNLFVYDVETNFSRGRGAHNPSLARVPQLERALLAMREAIEEPPAIRQIADSAGLSPRSLDRLFHRELGLSPGRYYQMMRLHLARSLAEETALTVAEIAARTGFVSTATLSRAFSQNFGHTIRDLRKRRRQ